MARIRLIPATPTHLSAFLRHPAELAAILGSSIPEGWPQFPEAVPFTLEALRARPEEARWWMYFFLDDATGLLVGSGGYAGPPADRSVEIGYEIAPAHRRRGFASAAASRLVEAAFATSDVDRVVAHTLAGDPASAGVLEAVGFARAETITHPEQGEIRRWVRERRASSD